MVANHFRWDFYGLSTDSKPDATNPKVADGSTYYEADTSKLYVWYKDQWYEKQAGGELPVATSETLGGIKVGDGLSITEAGVLSSSGGGGEAGAFKLLTTEDYNYPADNPDGVAPWLLPAGMYLTTWGTHFYFNKNAKYNYNPTYIILVGPQSTQDGSERRIYFLGGATINSNYFQDTNGTGGNAGRCSFDATQG